MMRRPVRVEHIVGTGSMIYRNKDRNSGRCRCRKTGTRHRSGIFPLPNNQRNNYLSTIKFFNNQTMIIVPVKDGENIERALKKFKRKSDRTGIIKELRARQAFQKPSVTNRKKMMKAEYVQSLRAREE